MSNGFPGFMSKVRILPALGNMFGIGGGGYEVGWIGFLWGRSLCLGLGWCVTLSIEYASDKHRRSLFFLLGGCVN